MKNKFNFLLVFLLVLTLSFISAGTLKVTEEHPFLIDGEWIPASELKVGDELTLLNGSKVVIKNINDFETEEPFPVYNLEAGEYHNFVVCGEEDCLNNSLGVVVHNSNNIKKKWFFFERFVKKPCSWTNDDWNEYLLWKSNPDKPIVETSKKFVMVGKEVVHIEDGRATFGSGGAVFFEAGSGGKRVVKVARGDLFLDPKFGSSTLKSKISSAQRLEEYYINEIKNMKLADSLGLRKFYGEVNIGNIDNILDVNRNPLNKNLLGRRAYSMDYVDGGWPREMKKYISDLTVKDAMQKYKKLYDAGYVQLDTQFLVTRSGEIEIIDWGGVFQRGSTSLEVSWEEVASKIIGMLGY